MSSINNAKLLCKGALKYLRIAKEAFNEGLHDASATNCQISAELLIKSAYLLLGHLFPHKEITLSTSTTDQ
ncbi:HEPN domain-containing protein [Stygiolobus sp. RP850M]|uniref:HEPN domain-containing protein n=1 Tax=Stygiolobus sp. RP850M TaxID=3133137 RepID=UPI00307CD7C3